jgi:glycerol uptake facilitator-like aquaporin
MKVKYFSELIGTLFLTMMVLGSGIMAQNLFPGSVGGALLANSLATGAGLFVLIQTLGTLSGCHLNPVVSFVEFLWGRLNRREFFGYAVVQMTGAYLGVLLTHLMFHLSLFELSTIERAGSHLWLSEIIATFGLICVIALSGRKHVEFAPFSVSAYITSAYWFTSSTSFVNPAITFARGFTNTFGGMDLSHFTPYVISQFVGALLAWLLIEKMKKSEGQI